MIKKLLKSFVIFLVILGLFFSNIPFYALSGLIGSYIKTQGIVDKIWLLEQNHSSDVVDKFTSVRDVAEKLRIHNAMAAVANDAASESHTGTTGSANQASFTWTHTPAGTPRGVLVFVYTISATKKVVSVAYGGVAMTEIAGASAADTATEPGRIDTFFLGSGIGTGAKSIIVNRTNDATIMYAFAITQTAAADTEVYLPGIVLLQNNGTFAVQSVNDGSPGTNSVRYAAGYSGGSNILAAGTGSTVLGSIDFGAYTVTTARETTAGQGARNIGFNYATSDDRAAVHLAVREYTPPVNNPPSLTVLQPDGTGDTVNVGDPYDITYNLSDAEDAATVDFYYDSDTNNTNGYTAIASCQNQIEGAGAVCAWDTASMVPGVYYVYGIATDGVNPAVNDYSPGQITINAPSAVLTVSTFGSQTASLDSGSSNSYLGGVFAFSINTGTADVTGIKISNNGTAGNLSDVRLYYDTDGTYSGTESCFNSVCTDGGGGVLGASIAGSLPMSSGSTYYVFVIADIAGTIAGGLTADLQITNPSTDIATTATNSDVVAKNISGSTVIRPNVVDATDSALADGGRNGETFTITGTGFGTACGSISVQVAGLALTCNSVNNTTLSVTIPLAQTTTFGGTSANGLLVTVGGTADDARATYYIYPNISSVSTPSIGDAARELENITLNGTRFDSNINPGIINFTGGFGSVSASVVSWNDTAVTIAVPAAIGDNIYTGDVTLIRAAITGSKTDTAYGSNTFRILPRIISTSPINLKGGQGDTISVAGDHLCQSGVCPGSFSAANSVNFNGGSVTSGSSVWTHTSIPSIIIPATAADGNFNITSNTSYISNNLTYDIKLAPATPTNGIPSGQSDVALDPTLNGSAFSDGTDGDAHSDSEWQVDEEGTFAAPEWSALTGADIAVVVNNTNGTFAGLLAGQTSLACGKTYSFRIRYKDNGGVTSKEWSSWSTGSTFNTTSCYPNAVSYTNTETGLNNLGGRVGQTITISGSNFGAVANGSQANCAGGAGTGCLQIGAYTIPDANIGIWSATSIDFTIPSAISVYGNTVTVTAASQTDITPLSFKVYPDITAISPSGAGEAKEGDTITITGTRFGSSQGTNKVTIDGVAATIIGWTDASISATVPSAINDANNSVIVRAYQGTGGDNTIYDNSANFVVLPAITSITVPTAVADAAREYSALDSDGIITIGGNHFGASAGTATVLGVNAPTFVSWGSSVISSLQIPPAIADNSYTGNITITRSDAKSSTYAGFRILPRIISLNPASGIEDTSVTVIGNHFCQAGSASCPGVFSLSNIVKFGAADAKALVVWTNGDSSTSGVDVVAPAGSGAVAVKVISNDYESNTKDFSYVSSAPTDPSNLGQFKVDGLTVIPLGGGYNNSSVVLKADSTAAISINMILEVEASRTGFTGIPNFQSSPPESGMNFTQVTVTAAGLADGSYHWQARAKNVDTGETSNWISFGGNLESETDFSIDTVGPIISFVDKRDITDIQATIEWSTNESSTQQVAYSTSCPIGQADAAATFNVLANKQPSSPAGTGTAHSVILSGLTASTDYYFMVRSADAFGNYSYDPAIANSCNNFPTAAPQTRVMKTLEFYIEQLNNGTANFNKTFDAFISESKIDRTNIHFKSVIIEVFGVSKGGSGDITVAVDLNGAGAVNYILADPGANSTYWVFDKNANSLNFDCVSCTDNFTVDNTLNVSVSGAASTSLLGAKAIITYYYEPL